ncbi:3-oxoacyl-ACP reductase [Weissella halotolerans]|uniref:3-ketoacyl-(Acyl-carrier-protein) reductase n=1 Tax=Weissella halotolerans DSM 20190 TaxID=1123500 RepID=A0A0R2G5G1_9LACO|nr:3-oxoacyl-ACP reductase [Weissella halotolerans]KRN33413.1 3-ketoacyl-(acyl-carrier-protein) reductase [Weissella halotolerans DSM 20190]
MTDKDYHGKTVLLTGAASGIGAAQLATYLKLGARVYALDRKPIQIHHPALTSFVLDLSDALALAQWIADQQSWLDQVDIFLSTAGILDAFTPFLQETPVDFWQVMAINLEAPIVLTRAVLTGMVARQAGQILYMASIAGLVAGGGGAAYTTSKHALVGFMRQLALDYAGTVHVNAIAPGAINTPMNAADFAGSGEMAKEVAKATPVGRWAQPQEVADLSVFLTSPQADYIQGQVIPIDGGWLVK